jgi:hypothetical protein
MGISLLHYSKRDGTVQYLADFRRLNLQLERCPYPIPKISTLLQGIPKFFMVSSLDMNMGYYSTVLEEATSKYTALVVPWGKFRFLRLPMGISGSNASPFWRSSL